MEQPRQIPFSVLDLAPIIEGSTASQALANSLELAQRTERWGYNRFWLAEHHNFVGIASAATSVVIAHIAAGTSRIRVGAGGIMLPNHSPLVIAEQFGTLEALYPGRIDLGLGRAPGTDRATMHALRRNLNEGVDTFPRSVQELQAFFEPAQPGQRVRAVPGEGLRVPIWLLGSSLFSAQLAARLGLPYAFASHFAPDQLMDALDIYRNEFQPSESLKEHYAMAGLNIFAADTDEAAQRLMTSLQMQFLRLQRGDPGKIQAPVDSMDDHWLPTEKAWVDRSLRESIAGSPQTIQRGIEAFLKRTQVTEIMATASIYDHGARQHSFKILSNLPSFKASEDSEL
ncbi:MAG: LLM class flavin-dependent oxidoreductase [Opitutales bacterium]|nr:LLM class flavin-dependent oxidoreductase [Opitutales bacterium]